MTDTGINEESILNKVQKMIDKAMSTTFPAERDSLLAKADAMMMKYSLDQSALLDPNRANIAGEARRTMPTIRTIHYFDDPYKVDSAIVDLTSQLFWYVAEHNHARIGYYGLHYSKVVGYPADLDFLEMMFLSIKLDIARNLNPSVNTNLGWTESLASFKRAGFKWEQMHLELQKHPSYPYIGQPWARNIGVAFTSHYRKWSEQHPEEVRNKTNPGLWRRSFIEGYLVEIADRLRKMRAETLKSDSNLPALLAGRKSDIEEFFYEQFPEKRPVVYTPAELEAMRVANNKSKPVRYKAYKAPSIDRTAFGAGMRSAANADLSGRGTQVNNRKESLGE